VDNVPRSKTITISLTCGKVTVIDSRDYGKVSAYKWYAERTKRGSWYAATTINRRIVRMHQLILPDAAERDHKDGDGLNNRRNNLRPVTHAQNMHNSRKIRKPGLSSRYKGVAFQSRLKSRPWQARLGDLHLGYFASEEEAGAAYDRAAEQQRGEYARTNGLTVDIRPNHRYRVVSKAFKAVPTPNHPEARILIYVLACGHTHSISACKADKIGNESRCKTCSEGK
jgi:hypothetical protein